LSRLGVAVRRRLDWITGFIGHLYIPLVSTSSYSATANLHNSQFITAPSKPFLAFVFTSRSLATASNSGDSSASHAHVVPSPTLLQNCLPAVYSGALSPVLCCSCQLPTISLPSLLYYSDNCQLPRLSQLSVSIVIAQQYLDCCLRIRYRGNVFTEPLRTSERLHWSHYFGLQASCHSI
jgi:hypothetical protein